MTLWYIVVGAVVGGLVYLGLRRRRKRPKDSPGVGGDPPGDDHKSPREVGP